MAEETLTNSVEDDDLSSAPGVETEVEDQETDETDEGAEGAEDDDSEEVEHDGQKYRVPKALKPALLMQADYTRKTQELAESRRELEAQKVQVAQASAEQLRATAKVISLDEQLAAYAAIDWDAWRRYDRENGSDETTGLILKHQQLKDAREKAAGALWQSQQQQAVEAQREDAKRIEEAVAVLSRDIPGWSPELASNLDNFAQKRFGFTASEVATYAKADPRVAKLLHAAFVADQAKPKTQTPAKAPAATVKPVPAVGARSAPAAKNPDRMTTDEWVKYERARMAKKASR